MTLKDIAEMAGVSTMTVSNVINGKTSRVSQKTRDKINSIIEEYNYVPNMNARSLSNNSSHIIGVVTFLEDKDYASGYNYFENPYVSTMIGTIETELHKNGYFTMLQSVSRSSDILSLVKNWNVDGMILVFPTSAQNLEKLMDAANCPIATFDSNYSHPNLINVISDDEKGLYLSTKYMIITVTPRLHLQLIMREISSSPNVLTDTKKLWRTVIFLSVLNIFSAIHLHMRAVSKPAVPLQAASHQSQQW